MTAGAPPPLSRAREHAARGEHGRAIDALVEHHQYIESSMAGTLRAILKEMRRHTAERLAILEELREQSRARAELAEQVRAQSRTWRRRYTALAAIMICALSLGLVLAVRAELRALEAGQDRGVLRLDMRELREDLDALHLELDPDGGAWASSDDRLWTDPQQRLD